MLYSNDFDNSFKCFNIYTIKLLFPFRITFFSIYSIKPLREILISACIFKIPLKVFYFSSILLESPIGININILYFIIFY